MGETKTMFLRIFRYRVRPEMRDRHLAVQARAAKIYKRHLPDPPTYFRAATDPNQWVELHWYSDRQACRKVAETVSRDAELTQLWKEFQDTLDVGFPMSLEEYGQYELPVPVGVSPLAQPPIDAGPPRAAMPPREPAPREPAPREAMPRDRAANEPPSNDPPQRASATVPPADRNLGHTGPAPRTDDDAIEVVDDAPPGHSGAGFPLDDHRLG
jgi:hypothetical protein